MSGSFREYQEALRNLLGIESEVKRWQTHLLSIDPERIYRYGDDPTWDLLKYDHTCGQMSHTVPNISGTYPELYWPEFYFRILASSEPNRVLTMSMNINDFFVLEYVPPEEYPLYVGGATITEEFEKLLSGT